MKFFDFFSESPELLIAKFRMSIDKIDLQIIELLGFRFNYIKQIANIKERHQIPLEDIKRLQEIEKNIERFIYLQNFPQEKEIQAIFKSIIHESIEYQKKIYNGEIQSTSKNYRQ